MDPEDKPKVSIGLPVYNGEDFISAAIDSLLAQTYTDFELIISDNASTDRTEEICREYERKDLRIRYCRSNINYGAAWNFNRTFHKSRGKYFKWAAHDDLHHPQFLEKCVKVLDENPEVVLCFCRTTFVDEEGHEYKEYDYPADLFNAPRKKRFLHFASAAHIVHEIFGLIRSEVLRETPLIGSYLGSDLVLLGKLSLYGPFLQLPEKLFQHREHDKRSMLNPQGAKNFTQWFDSSKSGKFVMPHWRRLFENFRTLMNQPNMRPLEKVACFVELARAAKWRRHRLWEELLSMRHLFRD
jgi:glycosyltransferase involved in cell wall biosynthesis